jgi:16S rRNA C1402 (ribose-2'-O) methylase RsmI
MENQLKTMQEVLVVEQEDHRETRELVNAFNS